MISPILMRAQIARELRDYAARFNTGTPPEPGLYLARIDITHAGTVLYTRRSFEEWDGAKWPFVGWNGTTGGVVTGWLRVED